MTARTFTVRLTEAQFTALQGAVGRAQDEMEAEQEGQDNEYGARIRRNLGTIERAWQQVAHGWYASGRGKR